MRLISDKTNLSASFARIDDSEEVNKLWDYHVQDVEAQAGYIMQENDGRLNNSYRCQMRDDWVNELKWTS